MQSLDVDIDNLLLLHAKDSPFGLEDILTAAGFTVFSAGISDTDPAAILRCTPCDMVVVESASVSRAMLDRLAAGFTARQQHVVIFSRSLGKALQGHAFQLGIIAHELEAVTAAQARSLIDLAGYFFLSHSELEKELSTLQQAQSDHRYVEKAKYLLMEQRGLSEDAAYAFLRKSAMDCGQRIVDISRALTIELERHPFSASDRRDGS